MNRAAGLFVVGVLLCGGVGCQTPDPGTPLAAADPRPAEWLEAMEAVASRRMALRARARLDLDAEDVALDRPQRMAVERPDRLRFEILGLFDQLAAVIVTNGRRYQAYDVRNQDFQEGPVDAQLLWRLARVDLAPDDAVALLLGAPRPAPDLLPVNGLSFEDGSVGVSRIDASAVVRESYRFNGAGQVTEMARFEASGEPIWRAGFRDYRDVPGADGQPVAFAHDVTLEFVRVKARVRLVFKHVVLVDALPDALFELVLPDAQATARSAAAVSEPGSHRGGPTFP